MQETAGERKGDGGSTDRGEPAPDAVWNSAIVASLFDRMSEGVIVADVRGRFVAVNAAARRISKTYDPSDPGGGPSTSTSIGRTGRRGPIRRTCRSRPPSAGKRPEKW